MRINRYIAVSGVCSRRAAEELITSGKIKVNGKVVTNLATEINEYNDTVMLDGKKLALINKKIYVMFNKPKGCICSLSDEKGRKTIMDYLTDFADKKVFPIGRLDYDSEGLLIITNDGDLSNKITQPANEIPKTYLVKINGTLTQDELATVRNGVIIDGYPLRKSRIKVLEVTSDNITRMEVTIYEGKNRQIHRMFETVGKEVIFLKRMKIGDLKVGGLSRGGYRYLTQKEIDYLLKY
jgi:23S rRNA pseudouridine2605 synthase